MARDNDKGLYLPLKINLSEWEKSLAEADADLQKAMREMRSAVSDVKLRYDVEIAGAKAAGNDIKVLELENQKLNQIYATQKQVVEALNRAYEKSVQEKGASAKASQQLAQQLVRESKQLDRIKMQIDGKNLNIGKSISDGLAKVSPEFAKIRTAVSGVTSSLSGMGTTAAAAATAIGTIGVAVAGVAAAYGGAKAISSHLRDTAEEAANASESVFMLAERLNLTYNEAEQLDAVFTLDGTSAESFINAVQKLNKQLMTAGEDGNTASNMLKRFNVELRNADGTQKSYIDQLQALADGYRSAKAAGEELDYVTATLGSAGNQYVHLLNGLDDYIAKTKELTRAKQTDYDLNHELLTINGQLLLQQKELAKASGNAYGNSAVEAKKQELAYLKERTRLMNENKELYKEFSENMKIFNKLVITVEGTTSVWLDKLKNGLMKVAMGWAMLFGIKPEMPKLEEVPKETKPIQVPIEIEDKKAEKELLKEQEKLEEKRKEVRERFQKELRDIQSNDYQREINALEDKKSAYISEGIAEVEAERLFALQKEAIDQKYWDKQDTERKKQVKAAQDAYQKEIEAAKKAREANISEAESTLKNNLKLMRYIKQEQEKGTYSDENARNFADKLYMRQQGFRQTDIDALKAFGVDRLKDIAGARDRIFGDFATKAPVTNNVTINFDGTVVEDVTAMNMLAEKVAGIITPAIEQAIKGGVQYGY